MNLLDRLKESKNRFEENMLEPLLFAQHLPKIKSLYWQSVPPRLGMEFRIKKSCQYWRCGASQSSTEIAWAYGHNMPKL